MNRRKFLGQAPCAALSSISVLNTLLNLKLATNASAQGLLPGTDRKALVCIFLQGGNDSYNMLVPRGAEYPAYATARSNLALAETNLRQLDQLPAGDGRLYGLHPAMPQLQAMFNGTENFAAGRRAAFVANVGTLVQPTTLAQYHAGSVPLPKALFSHSDQIDQWQTSVPQGLAQLTGWAGRMADVLHAAANTQQVSMSFAMGGTNVLQVGNNTEQFVISPSGALAFSDSTNAANLFAVKNRALKSLMEQTYANTVEESFARVTKGSVQAQENFQTAFTAATLSPVVEALWPAGNYIASNLRAVLRTIVAREALGLRRQTFFVSFGGHDLHGELLNAQNGLLGLLDGALGAFQRALELSGLANDVVTFTCSDFGRTLRSNGRGTDHAWGGNVIVMGGPVQGGRVFGTYPQFNQVGADLFGPLDVGYGGRMLPTTSVDAYFAEMLRWFGVSSTNMPYVLPNVANFWNPGSATPPLGFLG